MIRFTTGYGFEYMAASGALAFDGLGWPWEKPLRLAGLIDPRLFTIVIKTLTRESVRLFVQMDKIAKRWYDFCG